MGAPKKSKTGAPLRKTSGKPMRECCCTPPPWCCSLGSYNYVALNFGPGDGGNCNLLYGLTFGDYILPRTYLSTYSARWELLGDQIFNVGWFDNGYTYGNDYRRFGILVQLLGGLYPKECRLYASLTQRQRISILPPSLDPSYWQGTVSDLSDFFISRTPYDFRCPADYAKTHVLYSRTSSPTFPYKAIFCPDSVVTLTFIPGG